MPRGLRASDLPTLKQLSGGDQRLLLRLGALLEVRLAFTALALETLVGDQAGKKLLLDRRLKDADETAFCALMVESGAGELGLALVAGDAPGADDEPGWRLVALEDELGNPLFSRDQSALTSVEKTPEEPVEQAPMALLATLAPSLRTPVEGLLAARADDQRAAALEQLRYARPSLPVVAELMPMLLADSADLVRERAIGLLAAAGAAAVVVDLVRALHRRDDGGLARLADAAAQLPGMQQDLVVAAMLASVARGQAGPGLVALCARLAAHLAFHPGLERLLELLLPTGLSLVDLVRRLQDHAGPRVAAALAKSLGAGAESDATLVVLLAHESTLRCDSVDLQQLVERGLTLLMSPEPQPRERMALAAALRRLTLLETASGQLASGQYGGAALVPVLLGQRFRDLARSADTSGYWLLAELCRDGRVPKELGQQLAGDLVLLLRSAPGTHVIAALEQGLPGLLPADDAVRSRLVEPMVAAVDRFVGDRTRDLVTVALISIGASALPPLWVIAAEHPEPARRHFAITVLPELIAAAAPQTAPAAVDQLLAGLHRAGQGSERGELVASAARLLALPVLHRDAARVTAVESACSGLGRWAAEAWGHLASAPGCPAVVRRQVVDRLLADLTAEIGDHPAVAEVDAKGETTWVLDEQLAHHTEDVPRILAALDSIAAGVIARSDAGSPDAAQDFDLLRQLTQRLCQQWRQVASWNTVWGPANVIDLAKTLASIAARPGFPGNLRLTVVQSLQPRVLQLPIAKALAPVYAIAASDGSVIASLAGRAANALVERTAEGYYAEDEFAQIAEIAIEFLAIPHLGNEADRLRRRLADTLTGLRQHLGARELQRLREVRAGLVPELADKLDWA